MLIFFTLNIQICARLDQVRLITPDEDAAASIIISVIITAVLFPAELEKKQAYNLLFNGTSLLFVCKKTTTSAGPAILMVKFESLLLSHCGLNLIKPQWSACTANVVTRHWRKVQPV